MIYESLDLIPNKYKVIYADPPWKYNDEKNHDPRMGGITYDTMTNDELKEMPISEIADKDCALFLWVTMPKLNECFSIIESWGFKYITCAFVWVKTTKKGVYSGLGHWVNGNAELCLFCKRGKPKRVNKNVKQIVLSPVSEHSKKPNEVRDRIVSLMGDVPRIELFSRQEIDGWDSFGNQIKKRGLF